jgi:hypothetical protein
MEYSTPYFAQWESPELIEQFILNPSAAAADPRWAQSGAANLEEYVRWSRHLCGMACLKMMLAAKQRRLYPLFDLMRHALRANAYIEMPDHTGASTSEIKGLIYAPFIAMIETEFGLQGEVITGISTQDIPKLMKRGDYFLASVHPSIRTPGKTPPKRGGHLVLITRIEQTEENEQHHFIFHNPSGLSESTQADVKLSHNQFEPFFAGRGMLISGN